MGGKTELAIFRPKQWIIILLCSFSITICSGQEASTETVRQLLEKGDKLYTKGNYEKAIELYQSISDSLKNDLYIEKRIGVSLIKLERYEEALPILNHLSSGSDTIDIYVDYSLALCLHNMGRYDDAIKMYEKCLQYIEKKSVGSGKDEINKRIMQCKFWKKISGTSLDVTITRLDSSINSPYPDYGCKILASGTTLIFTSRRKSNIPVANLILRPAEQIYLSKLTSGKWGKAEKSDPGITSSVNNAVAGISNSENKVYLYNDVNSGDIMQVEFNGKFSKPEFPEGDINTAGFTESSITVKEKGDVCFFVSNRTDLQNFGGKDIFMAELDSGKYWRKIKNTGPIVNSRYDEDFVFWSDEDTALYFSSNRENSVGGYDIFICRPGPDGNFLPPQNIGLPINTPLDDISFYKKGDKAWYSTTYRDNKEDIFEIGYHRQNFDSKWNNISISAVQKIDSFKIIKNIFFHNGKDDIDKNDSSILQLVNVLKNTTGAKIKLSGHSDWVGDEKVNDLLSFNRAKKLAELLVANGVDPKMLVIDFLGEKQPVTDTVFYSDSLLQLALQYNRLVKISILQQGIPYLTVENNGVAHSPGKPEPQYAIMIYLSEKPVRFFTDDTEIKEDYSEKDKLYFYHSRYSSSMQEVKKTYEMLKKKYNDVYMYTLNFY
jgi:outer membrane protein OmpA-like peptidoglycan-associated protein